MRRRPQVWTGFILTRIALAGVLALGLPAAHAGITLTGPFSSNPGGLTVGPGDTDLGLGQLWLGGAADTLLRVDGGSRLTAGDLSFATQLGFRGDGVFEGSGTLVSLTGALNRLEVGNWGVGSLTVANGAILDGRANAAVCANLFCGTFIGNAAGSDGTFTVTGAGSRASFLSSFTVGNAAVFQPPLDAFTFGTPGGVTRGTVRVLAGGHLVTESATIGGAPSGSQPTGTERTFGSLSVDGTGSLWQTTGGVNAATAVFVNIASHRNATGSLNVTNGGTVQIAGPASQINSVAVGLSGVGEATVSGIGSSLQFVGNNSGVLNIGRNAGATGTMAVRNGGQVTGVWYTGIGRDGATGGLTIDGANTLYRADGNTLLAAAGGAGSFVAGLDVGRNGGTGRLTVSNGGRVELVATTARSNGPNLMVGRDAGSMGTLTISGPGSTVALSAASTVPGGGPAEARNPLVRVGSLGTGLLTITGGGALEMTGNAVSTVADTRTTSLFIGGTGDTGSGGTGVALVSGAGSRITMTGSDAFVGVGIGAGASGTLTVANQASVNSMIINVGRSGGVGVMNLDGGTINLSGQQTGNLLSGSGISVGTGGSSGIFTMANGAAVTINNAAGTVTAGMNLGGSGSFAGGVGVMTMSGGSRVDIFAPSGLGGVSIGRSGTGTLTMSNSAIDTHGNGGIVIGRDAGSVGTLVMNDSSTISTDFVGVGRNRVAGVTSDGGIATLIVNSGSTVTANTIEIGAKGFLGGNGTLVGSLINHGVVNPGNSPGTLVIDGSFVNATGGRIVLEVESDGAGGFVTDHLIFSEGSRIDLAGAQITFSFLGTTDPTAFQASGQFDIDTFVLQRTASGDVALADAAFAGVTFGAESPSYRFEDFRFDAATGAVFTAAAVPEPATWASLAAGLALLTALRRRRRT